MEYVRDREKIAGDAIVSRVRIGCNVHKQRDRVRGANKARVRQGLTRKKKRYRREMNTRTARRMRRGTHGRDYFGVAAPATTTTTTTTMTTSTSTRATSDRLFTRKGGNIKGMRACVSLLSLPLSALVSD